MLNVIVIHTHTQKKKITEFVMNTVTGNKKKSVWLCAIEKNKNQVMG